MARNLDATTIAELNKNNTYPIQLISIRLTPIFAPSGTATANLIPHTQVIFNGEARAIPNATEIANINQPLTSAQTTTGGDPIPSAVFESLRVAQTNIQEGSSVTYTVSEEGEEDLIYSFNDVRAENGFYNFDVPVNFLTQTLTGTSVPASELASSDNSSLYLTTCYKDVVYNDPTLVYSDPDGTKTTAQVGPRTYRPGSGVLSLSAVEETQDIKANSINIRLAGVPNTIISVLESNDGQIIGGEVTIHQAFWDEDAGRVIRRGTTNEPAVYKKWEGIIYSASTDEENTRSGDVNITLECKSKIAILLNTKAGRFTSEPSFQEFNTEDRSMEFVPNMVNFNPRFGAQN